MSGEDPMAEVARAAMVEALVLQEMDLMGKDADDVADYLADRGIEGYRSHPESCPVALWLDERVMGVGDSRVLAVDREQVRLRTGRGEVALTPSPAISRFVEEFDAGSFPDLDAEEEEDDMDDLDDHNDESEDLQ